MNSKTIKELLVMDDTQASYNVWYDWFAKSKTLLGKYKRIVKPILRALPKQFDNHYVFVKESIPMWCNGYVYKIYATPKEDSVSDICVGKDATGYYAYIYYGEERPQKEIIKVKTIKELKQWLNENC